MSLSKPLPGDLKRKLNSSHNNNNNHENKSRKKSSKRKCCVKGCVKTSKLHTFPPIWKTAGTIVLEDVEKVERVKEWRTFCDNEELGDHPLWYLHQNFFICSSHFTERDYTCPLKKRLKNCSKPSQKSGSDEYVGTSIERDNGERNEANDCGARGCESVNSDLGGLVNFSSNGEGIGNYKSGSNECVAGVCTVRNESLMEGTLDIEENDRGAFNDDSYNEHRYSYKETESDVLIDLTKCQGKKKECSKNIHSTPNKDSNERKLIAEHNCCKGTQNNNSEQNEKLMESTLDMEENDGRAVNDDSYNKHGYCHKERESDVLIDLTNNGEGIENCQECSKNIDSISNNGSNERKVIAEHNYCKGTQNDSCETHHNVSGKEPRDINETITMSTSKIVKQCCMQNCLNTNEDHSMFRFPKVVGMKRGQRFVDTSLLKRFRDWIIACGMSHLLLLDPIAVHSKYFVCSAHFNDSSFTNSKQNRLKHNAIPSQNLNPISSYVLIQEYDLNLTKWKDSSFEKEIFFTKQSCALAFEEDISSLSWSICKHCNEKIMVSSLKKKVKCQHKSQCWKYSVFNNMDPGEIPEELKDLTFIEEQVIARVHPLITVFKVKGHQYAYKGNVISFSQDVQEIATQLPHKVKDLNSVICIKFQQSSEKYHDFFIRQERVRRALHWLKKNNPLYKDIVISEENLQTLPENGSVCDDLLSVSIDSEKEHEDVQNDDQEDENSQSNIQQSGVPHKLSPHQDEAINKCLKWASMSQDPIKEKDTPGFVASAFPTLYPFGAADLNDSRLQEIKTADYFRHLMNYHDGRFAQHPTFRFFAYNVWQRWTALTDGNVFVKNNKEFQNMTVSQLKELISENQNVMKQIMYQASNLKGSKAYWNARSNELKDMVEQLGLPTLFLTLSCADGHWEDLYKLLTDVDVESLSAAQRRKLVQDNPHVVDSFFDYRVKSLIKNVLETHYEVIDYWYRIEYQHRGSPHIHGIFWVKNAPDVSNIENESEEYVTDVINYFSKLIEAWNPIINPDKGDNHPCRRNYKNVQDFEEDLAQLLHMVQRHVCSNDYCYRVNKKTKKRECRFKFPREMQETASMEKGDNQEMEFRPRRNDPHLNKFNAFLIQLWRANMDISPVISKRALLAYLSKYISKCEVRSHSLQEIFSTVTNLLNGDLSAKKVIHRVFMKSCAERDIGAQEVCHSLLRLSLHSAGGRNFVTVNLSDKTWVQLEHENFEKHGKSTVEKYKDRPDRLENMSLWNFAKKHDMSNFLEKKKENIVRVFPKLKMNHEDQNANEDYYKQQIFLHLPWRDEAQIKDELETWEELFMRYNINDTIKDLNKLGDSMTDANVEDEYESSEDESDDEDYGEILEELLSSRLGPKSNVPTINLGNRKVDKDYDWKNSFEKYTEYGSIADFENYIEKMKKTQPQKNQETLDLPDVQLSNDQKEIVNIVKQQIMRIKMPHLHVDKTDETIKRIIVQGKAGTGKSLIIKTITTLLKRELGPGSFLLATPTGVSAVLINGKTLHSIFKLPRKSKKFTPLTGERAREMCNMMKDVKCLILDEFSMVGCNTLAMINRRCKDATGSDEDFGGLTVLFFGDIKQLLPVKDYSFFSKTQRSFLGKEGKVLINNFQKAFLLSTCHRQAEDQEFLRFLDDMSEIKVSKSDFQYISSRFMHNVSIEDKETFKDALRLFSTKEEVKEFNIQKLAELKDPQTGMATPVLKIKAKHNCSKAKKESTDNAEGLERQMFLAKGCKVMLRSNLWIEEKLCNGTIGTVHDIIFAPESETPSVILCEFPSYNGPTLIPDTKIVPIKPILKSWTNANGVNCTRYQFPITLCYACSIHKSQGMTLDKAIINIGVCDFSLGLSYVAFSRVRSLKDLLIEPFCYKRIQPSNAILAALEMRNDFLTNLLNKL